MGSLREHWKPIHGYPRYLISNHGHVRDLEAGRYLRYSLAGGNTVSLQGAVTRRKHFVHDLVLDAFDPDGEGEAVRFKDGNKSNCRIDNLERVSSIGEIRTIIEQQYKRNEV